MLKCFPEVDLTAGERLIPINAAMRPEAVKVHNFLNNNTVKQLSNVGVNKTFLVPITASANLCS